MTDPKCTDPDTRKDCANCRFNPANGASGSQQKPDITDRGCRTWQPVREPQR